MAQPHRFLAAHPVEGEAAHPSDLRRHFPARGLDRADDGPRELVDCSRREGPSPSPPFATPKPKKRMLTCLETPLFSSNLLLARANLRNVGVMMSSSGSTLELSYCTKVDEPL